MRWLHYSLATICLTLATATAAVGDQGFPNLFFAFDNGTGRGQVPMPEQANLVAELGYAGIGYTGTAKIPEMLAALDEKNLGMFSIYVGVLVGKDGPQVDPSLKEAIKQLKGRETIIWLTIRGGKPSSPDFDDQAVQILNELADLAQESGIRIAMYPHTGFYVATVDDAIRLAKKANRENVGASLNLCHWLKLDDEKNLDQVLTAVMPHLFLVSINGADSGDTRAMGWDRLIQTLDRGSYDVQGFLRALQRHGYTGPIGLQCYNVTGDMRDNLRRSIDAWRSFSPQAPQPLKGILVVPANNTALHISVDRPDAVTLKTPSHLVEVGSPQDPIAVQLAPTMAPDGTMNRAQGRLLATIPAADMDDGTREFQLAALKEPAIAGQHQFRFEASSETTIKLLDGDAPVLAYNHGVITDDKVPETDSRKSRGCYIHPLWGLNGEILTDDFPSDHFHHHGVFWTWPHVQIDGQEYDLWADRGIKQKFVKWICQEAGPLAGVLAVENGWFVGDDLVMTERVWIRTYHVSDASRAVDLEFTWIPVGKPVTLWGAPGKSYGGLTVRFAVKRDTKGIITVPEGRTTQDLREARLSWADLSYTFDGSPGVSGGAVFIHPQHPDFPPTWLTRHYGPLCVGWPGVVSKTFEPGKPIRASYRLWIHQGEVDVTQLQQAYNGYAAASDVKWE